jgi:hypothetical protein
MIGPDWRSNPDRYFDYIGDRDWFPKYPIRSIYWRCRECGRAFVGWHSQNVRQEREAVTLDFVFDVYGFCRCRYRESAGLARERERRASLGLDLGVTRESINKRKKNNRRRNDGPEHEGGTS